MRIAVIHNQPYLANPRDSKATILRAAAEFGVLGEVELVEASLAMAGHKCTVFSASDAEELCRFLSCNRPDLIFNCCEGLAGSAALEMNVAAMFELFKINFTGSGALALGLALDKSRTKLLLRGRGIPTPNHVTIAPGEDASAAGDLRFPLIVKPAAEDASIGIDDDAVVHDSDSLADRVKYIWDMFQQPALVEEFIEGREFNVSLITDPAGGWIALPVGEFSFELLAAGRPHIVGYDAKWNPSADFTQAMASQCLTRIDDALAERIATIAIEAATTLGLRDYGRVDLRVRSADAAPFVLEVNPNPDLSDECEFLRAARASGRSNHETICEIVARATDRGQRHG